MDSCVCRGFAIERPAVIASLLATWDRESKIIQKWWADSPAEKKRLAALVENLHDDFLTRCR